MCIAVFSVKILFVRAGICASTNKAVESTVILLAFQQGLSFCEVCYFSYFEIEYVDCLLTTQLETDKSKALNVNL